MQTCKWVGWVEWVFWVDWVVWVIWVIKFLNLYRLGGIKIVYISKLKMAGTKWWLNSGISK